MENVDNLLRILAIVIIAPFATLSHELGHAIPALILSKGEVIVTLGSGSDKKRVFRFGRLTIDLRSFFAFTGSVSWDRKRASRLSTAIVSAGGPLTTFMFLELLIILRNAVPGDLLKSMILTWCYYHFYQFAFTIFPIVYPKWLGPYKSNSSDGLKVIRAMFNR